MVKLMHRFHQESPRVVELEVGLHYGCFDGDHRCSVVVKLVMGLHHQRCKKVKFMMIGVPRSVRLVLELTIRTPTSM